MNAPQQPQVQNAFLFPPGRLVQGDLYVPNDTDMKGNKLTIKTGANAGKERVEFFFKLAIPKAKAVWWEEEWGAKILALANSYWPQQQASNPKFSWKIEDGDDATPNFERNGRKNCDTEGFKGCWIVKFSSGFAVKILDAEGNPMLQPGLVKRGFWVEVYGTVNSNQDAIKPGVFINHSFVYFRAPDKEIVSGPDPRTLGAGRAPLPAGVTGAPPSSAVPSGVPSTPAMPSVTPSTPYAAPAVPGAATPTPTAVAPNPGFIAPPSTAAAPDAPGAPSAPAAPSAPPADALGAPAGHRMVNPKGAAYATFTGKGWTDDMLIAHGHMVRL